MIGRGGPYLPRWPSASWKGLVDIIYHIYIYDIYIYIILYDIIQMLKFLTNI